MLMPGRKHSAESSYRYGFNGKENDNEVKGIGNQLDFKTRIFDNRIARFLSVDLITKSFPMLSPYQFASNSPLYGIGIDGLEMMNPRAINAGLNFVESQMGMKAMKGDPEAQRAFDAMLSAKFKIGFAQFGLGSLGSFGFFGSMPLFTNITARASMFYATHSVATANIGAFVIELLNPDPNGTPGLEFTQGDEVARGLKLLFKLPKAPLIDGAPRFVLNTSKLDYLFGKLKYQNLKGDDLVAYANSAENVGKSTVSKLKHNQDRAADLAKTMEFWGIKENEAGLAKLGEYFEAGLRGTIIGAPDVTQHGTSITREITLIYPSGPKKGQNAGTMRISYFYQNSDMNSTPEISTIIAIPIGRD